MHFKAKALVVGTGHYGPFKDDIGTEREGRTIPYVDLLSMDDGESPVVRATLPRDVEAPALRSEIEGRFAVVPKGNGVGLRYLGLAAEKPAVRAA